MKKGLLAAVGALVASGSVAFGQSFAPASSGANSQLTVLGPLTPTTEDSPPIMQSPISGSRGDAGRIWGSTDYLLWWVKSAPVPVPLLTTFAPNTPSAATGFGGQLGAPGTVVLSPDHQGYDAFSGGRFFVGGWLDSEHRIGLEVGGFLTETRTSTTSIQSDPNGTLPLRVPFFNVPPGAGFPLGQSSFLLSDPAFANGGQILASSLRFWGVDGHALFNIIDNNQLRMSFLGGFRYLDLQEGLTIADRETFLVAPKSTYVGTDEFSTRNQFYGAQLGAKAEADFGRFYGSILADVSLGANHESVAVAGNSTITALGGATTVTPGGIFAQATNAGRRTHTAFDAVPEVQLRFGVKLTQSIRAYVGYDFLYESTVVRPGDQIDRVLNFTGNPAINGGSTTLTGLARPTPQLNQTDFWAQGITFGLEFRY